jgi:NADPH2:quinone reductase
MTRLMNWRGRLMPVGFASGEIPNVPMNLPLLKNYSIVGVFAGAWSEKFPLESSAANERLMQLVRSGHLHPHVSGVLPLERVAEVMSAVANRTVVGRVVLRIR